jgi:NADH dehydrogenase
MTIITETPKLVTIFGGSGFIGRHVVRALAKRGWRVRAAVRRPDLAGFLQPLGLVGWVQPVQANLRYRWSVDRAVEGADRVVNLVAILAEHRRQRFEVVHSFGARAVAEAARAAGHDSIVHMSALGADANSASDYQRSKAAGEAAVLETLPKSVIFRPSILFGPEDHFFNRFAAMARISPFLPVIGGGKTQLQPIFVGDVARAIADAVEGDARPGTTYELGGPEVKTFRECMELMLRIVERRRLLLPLPFGLASVLGGILGHLPGRALTTDQVRQLRVDNVVSEAARKEKRVIGAFGIEPATMAAILPSYLVRFRARGQFEQRRAEPKY